MSGQELFGYRGYILKNKGEILYDAGCCCLAHFSHPDDTRYFVRCEFPVPVGLHETSSPEIWTENENEANELIKDPEKTIAWIRRRIASDPKISRYVGQPIIEMDHQLPNYGGNPQLLAKTPQYIIFKCHWPASEEYCLASDYHGRGCHDSAPMWSVPITKAQASALLAHPESIGPLFESMSREYPYGD